MKRLFAVILLIGISLGCHAFSSFEHKLVAFLAYEHLTPATRAVLERYLDNTILDNASWPDHYRNSRGYEHTTKWHMLTVRTDGSVPRECIHPDGNGLAVPMLEIAIDSLMNYRQRTDSCTRVNIRYVVHFMGDYHCPGHIFFEDFPGGIGSRYGWLKLNYQGAQISYHSVWDGCLPKAHPDWNYDKYYSLVDVFDAEAQAQCIRGDIFTWGEECGRKCHQIYDWVHEGDTIDQKWIQDHIWIALEQISRAGYRLAHILNTCFDPDYSPKYPIQSF